MIRRSAATWLLLLALAGCAPSAPGLPSPREIRRSIESTKLQSELELQEEKLRKTRLEIASREARCCAWDHKVERLPAAKPIASMNTATAKGMLVFCSLAALVLCCGIRFA